MIEVKNQLVTIRQFAATQTAFTEGAIRHLIFNESENGLKESGALLRLGRRIYIDPQKWFDWIIASNGKDFLGGNND